MSASTCDPPYSSLPCVAGLWRLPHASGSAGQFAVDLDPLAAGGHLQASRKGISGQLLDPYVSRPLPAGEVVDQLVDYVGAALRATGDERSVVDGVEESSRTALVLAGNAR